MLTGRYERGIAATDLQWFLESNASYQDERYTSSGNFTQLDDFWLVDARVGLSSEIWSVIAYVDNLFDDDTISSAGSAIDLAEGYVDTPGVAPPGLPTAFLPPPRTYGLRFQVNYR